MLELELGVEGRARFVGGVSCFVVKKGPLCVSASDSLSAAAGMIARGGGSLAGMLTPEIGAPPRNELSSHTSWEDFQAVLVIAPGLFKCLADLALGAREGVNLARRLQLCKDVNTYGVGLRLQRLDAFLIRIAHIVHILLPRFRS